VGAAAILLSLATAASAADWPPATGDYAPYEDVSCRADGPRIDYPSRLQRRGVGGQVLYRVSVDAESRYVTAVVERSSGHPELDAAGLEVLPHWCFRAGRQNGSLVGGDILVPIRFQSR
jgi:TonB family protein